MNSKKILAAALLAMSAASASAQLYTESFEGWDGTTPDWLPAGWSEFHTDAEMPNRNNGEYTWHVIDPANSKTLPKASDGRYYAAIGYAKDENGNDMYSDEWLISPAFKLSEYGGTLNYDAAFAPLFLYRVGNGYIDWSEYDFVDGERIPAADLQIFVLKLQDDGTYGEYWDMFVSLCADWWTQPLSALMSAAFSSTTFHTSQSTIFLTDDDLKGATVRIAFRYVGEEGNIMGIDRFRMNYATLVEDAPAVPDPNADEGLIDALRTIETAKSPVDTYYDLSGRRAKGTLHGVTIVNGRKVIR